MSELPDHVRLVVLFGGQSAEHDVSCVSAGSVLGALDRDRYEVVPVGITRDGRWVLAEDGPPPLDPTGEEVDPLRAVRMGDVVFPILHGPMGEDGTVQGLLEVAGVPYVGCGVLGSALAMDKVAAKVALAAAGIPQARSVSIRHGVGGEVHDEDLGWPRFVKPANMGSSVGVSKVRSPGELAAAMEQAFLYDEWLVVESAIVGREVECAVLGGLEPQVTMLGEIVPKAEFYDYDDKYSGEGADLFVPADLPAAVHEEAQALALRAFAALRCDGLARVDFFYEEGGRLVVNEVNTMPGFTPYSMYPQLWAHAGIGYAELIDRLVALAFDRHHRRAAHTARTR